MSSKEKLKEAHVCIRIFKDDTVIITDQSGKEIKPLSQDKVEPITGPASTYHQALWYNSNPTCVWWGGKRYCY